MNTNRTRYSFKQINAYAMQYGTLAGGWGILTMVAFLAAFTYPWLSVLYELMLISYPFVVGILTVRFRNEVQPQGVFIFSKGFMHALMLSFYATLWLAVAIYVYLSYIDKGYVFNAFQAQMQDPNMVDYMKESGLTQQIKDYTGGLSATQLVEALREIHPSNYAMAMLDMGMIASPLIAFFVGLVCRRK